MADYDAKQFLSDELLKPPSPKRAVPSSIQFLKELIGPDRQLHAMRWLDEAGAHWSFVYDVTRDDAGVWRICGGGGGGGDLWESPGRSYPWVNLAGSYSAEGFFMGGEVYDCGQAIARVRLVSPEGLTAIAEDTVVNGVVLFLAYQPVEDPFVLVAELYDASGALLHTHPAFGPYGRDDPPPLPRHSLCLVADAIGVALFMWEDWISVRYQPFLAGGQSLSTGAPISVNCWRSRHAFLLVM